MAKVRLATFNCENLFRRYKFNSKNAAEIDSAVKDGFILDTKKFEIVLDDARTLTAKAIKDLKADIICLQEVESMDTLKNFNAQYLSSLGYKYKYLIDGNDPRLIDVAILSKYEADYIKTHQFKRTTDNKSYVFSRDCLEAQFTIDGKTFTVFVNHFKSMMGGRDETKTRRAEQAEEVINILRNKYGNKISKEKFAVVGDLNDYEEGNTSLSALLNNNNVENIVKRLKPSEQWTHWWDGAPKNEVDIRQIDYIFVSKAWASANPNAKPTINRKGLGISAPTTIKRYPEITDDKTVASDHCPVVIELEL